jgi:hypothetical protein
MPRARRRASLRRRDAVRRETPPLFHGRASMRGRLRRRDAVRRETPPPPPALRAAATSVLGAFFFFRVRSVLGRQGGHAEPTAPALAGADRRSGATPCLPKKAHLSSRAAARGRGQGSPRNDVPRIPRQRLGMAQTGAAPEWLRRRAPSFLRVLRASAVQRAFYVQPRVGRRRLGSGNRSGRRIARRSPRFSSTPSLDFGRPRSRAA